MARACDNTWPGFGQYPSRMDILWHSRFCTHRTPSTQCTSSALARRRAVRPMPPQVSCPRAAHAQSERAMGSEAICDVDDNYHIPDLSCFGSMQNFRAQASASRGRNSSDTNTQR